MSLPHRGQASFSPTSGTRPEYGHQAHQDYRNGLLHRSPLLSKWVSKLFPLQNRAIICITLGVSPPPLSLGLRRHGLKRRSLASFEPDD